MWPAGLSHVSICVASLLLAPLARAQDAPPSDHVVMLPCDGKCPTVTRNPVKLSGSIPSWPASVLNGPMVEGVVELRYTIGADGHVGDDVTVLRVLGPAEFVALAKQGVRSFVYQPALVDGEAVAVPHTLRILYQQPDLSLGGRHPVVVAYRRAVELFQQHKLDEADAALAEILRRPQLVFYERGLVASLQSLIALERNDFIGARELTDVALVFPDSELTPAISRILLHSAIAAALNMNDIVGASDLLDHLAKLPGADPADPQIKAFADLRRKLDPMVSFNALGNIPLSDGTEGFGFGLYRRHYALSDVKGTLKSVTVSCAFQEATSPFSPNTVWSIPKNWGDCSLFVRGAPGTTFQIIQYASPPSAGTEAASQMVASQQPMP